MVSMSRSDVNQEVPHLFPFIGISLLLPLSILVDSHGIMVMCPWHDFHEQTHRSASDAIVVAGPHAYKPQLFVVPSTGVLELEEFYSEFDFNFASEA